MGWISPNVVSRTKQYSRAKEFTFGGAVEARLQVEIASGQLATKPGPAMKSGMQNKRVSRANCGVLNSSLVSEHLRFAFE